MAEILTRFRIEALHGIWNIDVKIEDNMLILVGENGTGKSTVANFVYFFLTRQWHRMLEYDFKSITAVIDSHEIKLKRENFINHKRIRELSRILPSRMHSQFQQLLRENPRALYGDSEALKTISEELGVPYRVLVDFRSYTAHSSDEEVSPDEMVDVEKELNNVFKGRVLYLPTYRRIEQDLRSIFPGFEKEIRNLSEQIVPRNRRDELSYVELVEFGMQDVEQTIQNKVGDIKDNARTGLSTLTGTYLRDVIQGAYKSADFPAKLAGLDDHTINAIFGRIPIAILSEPERKRIREIIEHVKESGNIGQDDQVVAHFVTQLIELHKAQQEYERDVREFVSVSNSYLSGKEIFYDDIGFELYIKYQRSGENDQRLPLKALSSGEKQIVSLFSHMYLSDREGYFVIIDEPELSLSVPWQKRFLPDILKTGHCKGLIAVTHSPFIYDNILDQHAHSINEFIVTANELS
jgi:ABC-type oligopeptide transport system ATPase subunit